MLTAAARAGAHARRRRAAAAQGAAPRRERGAGRRRHHLPGVVRDARHRAARRSRCAGRWSTPATRSRSTVSRESYVKWLPSIYQRADLNGRNFYPRLPLDHPAPLRLRSRSMLDVIHTYFDPYEAPEKFLPWLASWSAMVLEEDWPIEKKRRLIRKAIELYRIRGTVKGLKLFISLFTGHEPDIKENEWPFRGWRIGDTSEIGIDTVVLPPVNLAHTFIVEMPVTLQGRLARGGDPHPRDHPDGEAGQHAVLPALRLRGAAATSCREFMAIGGGVIGGIGLGADDVGRHHVGRGAEASARSGGARRRRSNGRRAQDADAGDRRGSSSRPRAKAAAAQGAARRHRARRGQGRSALVEGGRLRRRRRGRWKRSHTQEFTSALRRRWTRRRRAEGKQAAGKTTRSTRTRPDRSDDTKDPKKDPEKK